MNQRPDTEMAPRLLLSMPQLTDPNFARSVVLLCQHDADGAWGLVLNRPTGKSAARLMSFDPPIAHDHDGGLTVWIGGPVEPQRGCLLLGELPGEASGPENPEDNEDGEDHKDSEAELKVRPTHSAGGGDDVLRLCEGLYLSGSAALLRRLLHAPRSPRGRLLLGYAGWGPGQLDEELRQSAWLLSDVDLDIVFDVEPARMWEVAIRRLGVDPSALHMSQGVH